MDFLNREAAFSFFVCGLSWLSIALGMALLRRSSRTPSMWLVACFTLQGVAAWAGTMAAHEAAALSGGLSYGSEVEGRRTALDIVRLAMLVGSLAALVEYGQRSLARHRAMLPGRRIYAVLAAWTAIGPFVVERGWVEFGLSALLAWPGVIAPALFLRALTKKQRLVRRGSLAVALGTVLASAIAGCLPIGVAQPALALLAATALWRVFARRAQTRLAQTRGIQPRWAKDRPLPVWRRAGVPAAFVLALAAGGLAIVGHRPPRPDLNLPDQQDIANLIDQIEIDAPPKQRSDLDRQLERCGLAVAPIVGLVLAVWGLSRLPFVR
jgi:hypothetical protein